MASFMEGEARHGAARQDSDEGEGKKEAATGGRRLLA